MYQLLGVISGEFLFETLEEHLFKAGIVYGRKAITGLFIREASWLIIAKNIAERRNAQLVERGLIREGEKIAIHFDI